MKKLLKGLYEYLIIILGANIAGFSVACVLLPNDAIDYGTAGFAIIISMLSNLNLSLCVILVFLPFLIAGGILLGRTFFFKALVGALAYTLALEYYEEMPFVLNTEHFLAVAFGGALLGVGLSLILRHGGCIDGSEILANIIIRKLSEKTGKEYGMTYILIAFNMVLYAVAFVLIDRDSALLSLLVFVTATIVIGTFTDHFDAIKQVTIITKEPDDLIAEIKTKLNKTCTIISSKGAIAGENSTLICYVTYFELQKMKEIIAANKAFSTVSTIDEILR